VIPHGGEAMSRFYAPPEKINGDTILIDGTEARHIINVMRLGENDTVTVFDGTGKEYVGFVKKIKQHAVLVQVVETRVPKPDRGPSVTLAQALPKKDKMDYVVEKATELGVVSIIPLISERTVVRLKKDKADTRISRWKRIALAASKQCGRTDVPEIASLQKYYNALDLSNSFDLTLDACLAENTIPVKDAFSGFSAGKVLIFIGPEGGFTPDEIKMTRRVPGIRCISLGSRVLKSDTAGLYLLSVLNYEFSS